MKKICVIDDDKIYRYTLRTLFRVIDIPNELIEYEYAEDALRFFKEESIAAIEAIDLIMLDLSMPIIDGWEFLESIKHKIDQLTHPPKIYIVSSSVDQNDRMRAKSIGIVTDYLTKPLSVSILKELLAK